MKIKHLILLTTTAVAASSLSSCKEEPYMITAEEEYTRNFIKEFGLIDPKQDWNLAEGSTVTVKVGSTPAEVKAYMKVDNTYYLVADLKDVAGDVKIPFDMPEGTKDIMVKINGKRYYTTPGGTVDPANPQSRVLIEPGEGDVAQVSWVDYRLYTAAEIFPIIYPNDKKWPDYTNGLGELRENTYPESDPRSHGIIPEDDPSNYDNPYVIMDFWFKDVDENGLTIYPMYWYTSLDYHTIGIFYFIKDGEYCAPGTEGATMVRQDLFEDKNHNDSPEQLLDCGVSWRFSKLNDITLTDINAAFKKDYKSLTEAKKDLFIAEKVQSPLSSDDNKWEWNEMTRSNTQILFNYLKSTYPDNYTSNYIHLVVGSSDNEEGEINSYGNIGNPIWDIKVFDWASVAADHTYAARGINIKVPSDLQFGFYLKRGSGDKYGYFYSITDYNCAAYQTEENAITTWAKDANNGYSDPILTNKPFACTYKHPASNNWFFSFEDAADATEYWDLNDLVFGVLGNFNVDEDDDRPDVDHSDIINKDPKDPDDSDDNNDDDNNNEVDEPYEWLLAVEDLGATDDFDFNDIIIGISSETINTLPDGARTDREATQYREVTFTALAAGGTLPAFVYYNDIPLYPNNYEGNEAVEWHKWFGDGYLSSGTMINTGSPIGKDNQKGKTCTLYFADDENFPFSVAKLGKGAKGGSGLKIKIVKTDDDVVYSVSDTEIGGESYFIQPSEAGSAPQMFLIPDAGYTGGWKWPIERSPIQTSYKNFGEWVKGASNAPEWYKDQKPTQVCRPIPSK